MKLEDYNNFYHVDISGQIEKWKNDTVLAIVKNSKRCSVKIKAKDKKHLKERFISNDKSYPATKHNKKVVTIIYSYLLYKALCEFP